MPPTTSSLLQSLPDSTNYNFSLKLNDDVVAKLRSAKDKPRLCVKNGEITDQISVPLGRLNTKLTINADNKLDKSIQKLHSENKKLAKLKEITKIGRLGSPTSPNMTVADQRSENLSHKLDNLKDLETIQLLNSENIAKSDLPVGVNSNVYTKAKDTLELNLDYAKFVDVPSPHLQSLFDKAGYGESHPFRLRVFCTKPVSYEPVVSDSSDNDDIIPGKKRKISDISASSSSNMSLVSRSESSQSSFDEMSEEETIPTKKLKPDKLIEKFESEYRVYKALYSKLSKAPKLDSASAERFVKMHNELSQLKYQLWNHKAL
ncbi:unnamed protein product [Kuraishia capsulata CBS 1993]|uniref:Uncharacterized protein n=1 Tax=Kuraishia capsulata CBS 1993 TaxID=1382522 RepID=W6MUR8_9ASCO|nr:uncharacterized protein KUCA_T00005480001 [Kuraishia capsulata CBS 1993]CDK29492.1 unnamed protein product [Kuraishia capsulata CBS 1993]